MAIIYDEAKRQATLQERGLDFAQAGEALDGFRLDEMRTHSPCEMRGQVLMIVWTQRGEDRRIISMRPVDEKTRRYYNDQKQRAR